MAIHDLGGPSHSAVFLESERQDQTSMFRFVRAKAKSRSSAGTSSRRKNRSTTSRPRLAYLVNAGHPCSNNAS